MSKYIAQISTGDHDEYREIHVVIDTTPERIQEITKEIRNQCELYAKSAIEHRRLYALAPKNDYSHSDPRTQAADVKNKESQKLEKHLVDGTLLINIPDFIHFFGRDEDYTIEDIEFMTIATYWSKLYAEQDEMRKAHLAYEADEVERDKRIAESRAAYAKLIQESLAKQRTNTVKNLQPKKKVYVRKQK